MFTARRVWLRRNDVVHQGILTHPSQLLMDAQKALEDFHRANVPPITDSPYNCHDKGERWKLPSDLKLKINWGAALDVRKRVVGLGILARDGRGRAQGACSVTVKVTTTAPEAEALATLHAMIFAKRSGNILGLCLREML